MNTPPAEISDDLHALLTSNPSSPPNETAILLGPGDDVERNDRYGAVPPSDPRTGKLVEHHTS